MNGSAHVIVFIMIFFIVVRFYYVLEYHGYTEGECLGEAIIVCRIVFCHHCRLGVDGLAVLPERRPHSEVLGREVDTQLLEGLFETRKGITNVEVLQAEIGKTLHIACVDLAHGVGTASLIAAIAREVCVGVVFAPYIIHEVRRYERLVTATERSPKRVSLSTRIPVAFAYSLEEDGEIYAFPLKRTAEIVVVTRSGVTYDTHVARIVYSLVSVGDNVIAVKVYVADITGMKTAHGTRIENVGAHERHIRFVGGSLFVGGKESVDGVSP